MDASPGRSIAGFIALIAVIAGLMLAGLVLYGG
jgi:hypothetical protein